MTDYVELLMDLLEIGPGRRMRFQTYLRSAVAGIVEEERVRRAGELTAAAEAKAADDVDWYMAAMRIPEDEPAYLCVDCRQELDGLGDAFRHQQTHGTLHGLEQRTAPRQRRRDEPKVTYG